MSINFSLKDISKISKIATIIIFLALIHCIGEPFGLQYYSTTSLTFCEIKPFLRRTFNPPLLKPANRYAQADKRQRHNK